MMKLTIARNPTIDMLRTSECPQGSWFRRSITVRSEDMPMARVIAPGKSKDKTTGLSSFSDSSGRPSGSSSPSSFGKDVWRPRARRRQQPAAIGTWPRNDLQNLALVPFMEGDYNLVYHLQPIVPPNSPPRGPPRESPVVEAMLT